jgi:hypothetical protein
MVRDIGNEVPQIRNGGQIKFLSLIGKYEQKSRRKIFLSGKKCEEIWRKNIWGRTGWIPPLKLFVSVFISIICLPFLPPQFTIFTDKQPIVESLYPTD